MIKSNAVATVRITADNHRLDAGLRASEAKFASFGRKVTSHLAGAGKRAGRFLNSAIDPMGQFSGAISDGITETIEFERQITRLAISQRRSTSQMGSFRDELTDVSNATGIARADLLAATNTFQSLTGDTKAAEQVIGAIGNTVLATGTAYDDVASTIAAIMQGFNIRPGQAQAALSILTEQGKDGAVELRGMGQELAELIPAFREFGDEKSFKGLTNLGATLQVVTSAYGDDVAKARTSMLALFNSMKNKSAQFEKAGIKIFDPQTGELRSFEAILDNLLGSDLVKAENAPKLKAILGTDEATTAVRILRDEYEKLQQLRGYGNKTGTIAEDARQAAAAPGSGIDRLKNRVKNGAGGAATWAVDKLDAGVRGVAEEFGYKSQETQIAEKQQRRRMERMAIAARSGAGGAASEKEIAILEGLGRGESAVSMLKLFEGVDKGSLEGLMGRLAPVLAQEDQAREFFGRGEGSTEALLAARSTIASGSDKYMPKMGTAVLDERAEAFSREKERAGWMAATHGPAASNLSAGELTNNAAAARAAGIAVDPAQLAFQIADAVARAVAKVEIAVNLDGNKVSDGVKNATNLRRTI